MQKLKIVLLGYGKMGREIEKMAVQKSHVIIARIDNALDWEEQAELVKDADMAIDFSTPDSVIDNISRCFAIDLPIVVGTTGWYAKMDDIKKQCEAGNHSLLWASNCSIGMNIFFKLNDLLAQMTSKFPAYKASLYEIHHSQKLDAPSGTAVTIADDIIQKHSGYQSWKLIEDTFEDIPKNTLPIAYERIGKVTGLHQVKYESDIDILSIKHEAKNRKGFAEGALLAAQWLSQRQGFYSMADVFE